MSQMNPNVISLVAGEDLSSYQYCFVAMTGTGTANAKKVSHQGTEGGTSVGILLNAPDAAGKEALVAIVGGTAKLKLGGTVGAGYQLTSTTSATGQRVGTAGNAISAIALEYGVSGDLIEVILGNGEAYAADA